MAPIFTKKYNPRPIGEEPLSGKPERENGEKTHERIAIEKKLEGVHPRDVVRCRLFKAGLSVHE
jgi:hypothetical protein